MVEDWELILTQDGSHSLYSKSFKASYHSTFGAITESQHIFIQAGLIHLIQSNIKRISILEYGMGTGLNAILSYLKILTRPDLTVDYTTIEAYPISRQIAAQLDYSNHLGYPEESEIFMQMHTCPFDSRIRLDDRFFFTKLKKKFSQISFNPIFDLVYYDAFDSSTQPELWNEAMIARVSRGMKIGAYLVSFCAKGSFKRGLKSLGFELESLPGPPGKREMTRARKHTFV